MPNQRIRLDRMFSPDGEAEVAEVSFVSSEPAAQWPVERYTVLSRDRLEGAGSFVLSALSGADPDQVPQEVVIELDSLRSGSSGTVWFGE